MTKTAIRACVRLLAGACLLTLIVAAPRPAQASPATEAACAQEGALAEKLARTRDKGTSMDDAVDAVLREGGNATREEAISIAALLFQRFRHMPVENVTFEFTRACMDDAE